MKLKITILILGTLIGFSPASATTFADAADTAAAIGEGCDTKPGREGGQQMCDDGLDCTGPFEGTYGHGICQLEE
jgi:hypothetical protein